MREHYHAVLTMAVVLFAMATAMAAVHFEEDFEGYAAITDLTTAGPWDELSGAWSLSTAANVTPGGMQSLLEPAGDDPAELRAAFGPVPNVELVEDTRLVVTFHTLTSATAADLASDTVPYFSGVAIYSFDGELWEPGDLNEKVGFGYASDASREYFAAHVVRWVAWDASEAPLVPDSEWVKLTVSLDGSFAHFEGSDSGDVYTITYVPLPGGDGPPGAKEWNAVTVGHQSGSGNGIDIFYDDIEIRGGPAAGTMVEDWHLF